MDDLAAAVFAILVIVVCVAAARFLLWLDDRRK